MGDMISLLGPEHECGQSIEGTPEAVGAGSMKLHVD